MGKKRREEHPNARAARMVMSGQLYRPKGWIDTSRRRRRPGQPGDSNWDPPGSQPPFAGIIEGVKGIFSFKFGKEGTPKEGHTLIADGDYHDDSKGFDGEDDDPGHDHFGRDFGTNRGKYTGP